MLGTIEEKDKKKSTKQGRTNFVGFKRGRKQKADHEIKKTRTIRMTDEHWADLLEIGEGNRVKAIESFIETYKGVESETPIKDDDLHGSD